MNMKGYKEENKKKKNIFIYYLDEKRINLYTFFIIIP